MQIQWNDYRKHILAIGLFLALVLIYFSPSVFQGKVIRQGDMEKYKGMVEEMIRYGKSGQNKDKEVVAWSGSMFSGMPTYTTTVMYAPRNYVGYLEKPMKWIDNYGGSILLVSLICFYVLMCVLGVNFWLAIAGSIAFAFASYNLIIIEAGHITKAYVIGYMPLVVAGIFLLFRNKLFMGAALTTLGITFSLLNNHIQITYYLALFCFILYLGFLFIEIREKQYRKLLKITGILLVCVIVGVLPNGKNLYSNMEMSKESLRGPTELTHETTQSGEKISSGLDIDYAFAWSYGKAETFTLMIPDFYGGASGGELDKSSELYQSLKARGAQVGESVRSYTYWGDQPFTSGPVYFGAIVCFLFVLGMFVIRHPLKWWIFGGTVFFIFLSWGRNFAAVNEFLFHYLPLYNKFRTPSMALVIPGLTFPLVAMWGLKEIVQQKVEKAYLKKSLYYAAGLTGGFCLLFALLPGMFLDFVSPLDVNYQLPDWYYKALVADRQSLLRADAFRSFVFILLGAVLVNWFRVTKDKVKTGKYMLMGLTALILVDLWGVDKRYLNDENFVSPHAVNPYPMTVADREILKDQDPSYRVLNLNDPFNETNTSYYHKSIGGYSPAKLRRYQELIDHRIMGEIQLIVTAFKNAKTAEEITNVFKNTPTLDMLNMRYVIYNPQQPPLYNPYADGNAWFVDSLEIVKNADAEIAALNRINPLVTAVVDERFAGELRGYTFRKDTNAVIEMTSYEPIKVVYRSKADTEQLAVFSEIYYPHGWQAFIDGKPVPHFRTDWILRGLKVPAGEHIIEFKFVPKAYLTAANIAAVSSLIVVLFFIFALVWSLWKYNRKPEA